MLTNYSYLTIDNLEGIYYITIFFSQFILDLELEFLKDILPPATPEGLTAEGLTPANSKRIYFVLFKSNHFFFFFFNNLYISIVLIWCLCFNLKLTAVLKKNIVFICL